jgi:cobalt/nickel transport system permease protein
MKKLILVVAAIMVVFAVMLPFASKTPDGLQKLTASSGNQQQPVWKGLMANYSVAFADPYVSVLVAGLLGTGIVLGASFALGSAMTQKKRSERPDKI